MSYVDSNLIPGETVVHRAKLHGMIFVPGIVLFVVIIGIFLLVAAIIRKATTEMAVTNKRVIIKTGLISRKTLEMNLAKVENIGVDQGIFGRMFNFGKITVVGTGGTHEEFSMVASPLDFRKAVQTQADVGQPA